MHGAHICASTKCANDSRAKRQRCIKVDMLVSTEPTPPSPVLYPFLPAISHIESLQCYENAYSDQCRSLGLVRLQEVDQSLSQLSNNLAQLKQQNQLKSLQLQRLNALLDQEKVSFCSLSLSLSLPLLYVCAPLQW